MKNKTISDKMLSFETDYFCLPVSEILSCYSQPEKQLVSNNLFCWKVTVNLTFKQQDIKLSLWDNSWWRLFYWLKLHCHNRLFMVEFYWLKYVSCNWVSHIEYLWIFPKKHLKEQLSISFFLICPFEVQCAIFF